MYDSATTSSLLLSVLNEWSPLSSGFSSRLDYQSSTERASQYVQIPVYAGEGLGTFIYDSTLREYVPHTPGDYFMHQEEIYGNNSSLRVRKSTLDLSWNFAPPHKLKGILNDCIWRGALNAEEHMDADFDVPAAWVPGYFTVRDMIRPASWTPPVSFANLTYRQDVDWTPKEAFPGTTGHLFAAPAYRNLSGYTEQSLQTGIGVNKTFDRWSLEHELDWITLTRIDSTATSYKFYDVGATIQQKYRLVGEWYVYLEEGAGWARENALDVASPPLPLDSSVYGHLKPGIQWKPISIGWAEAAYTYSVVTIPGTLDYRIAGGNDGGETQSITVSADVKTGNHLSINASYRTDFNKPIGAANYSVPSHTLSLEVKAFL